MYAIRSYYEDRFSINEVLTTITEKLIRRHPHVYAGVEISDEKELHERTNFV